MTLKRAALHAAKLAGLFVLMRTMTRRHPRILCYHAGNMGDEHRYNAKLFCVPEQLRRRLDWLHRKGFTPTTLDQATLEGAARRQGIPVVLTVDDGWYSCYRDLLPLMAKYGHKPTLYLHTQGYEAGTPIIQVTLRYILWKAAGRQVRLSGFGDLLDGAWNLARHETRQRLYKIAEEWLKVQDGAAVAACLERFGASLGISADELDLSSRRFSYMSFDELRQAAANGCSIELHGHVHDYLSEQPEFNHVNIDLCREKIIAAGLPRPKHYCYPSGAFDAAAPQVMRRAGVATAATCQPGLLRMRCADTNYLLPRFVDGGDVAMIEFEAEMSGIMDFLRRFGRRGADVRRMGRVS